jgi:hypothetical protein
VFRVHRPISSYTARLRVRARLLLAAHAAAALAGAGLLAFAIASLVTGPAPSALVLAVVWLAIGALALGGSWLAVARHAPVRGSAIAARIRRVDAALAQRFRSSLELAGDPVVIATAPDLVEAHARSVARDLERVSPARAIPWSSVFTLPFLVAIGAAVLAVVVLAAFDGARIGAYALTHPGARADSGGRIAAVVDRVEARLVFPGYLDLEPIALPSAGDLEVPRGTTIELVVHPRISARTASVELGAEKVRLRLEGESWHGSVIARESGWLRITLEEDGVALTDARQRRVTATADHAPEVFFLEPDSDRVIELADEIRIDWEATDDHGVRAVDLIVRTPAGEQRRRLARTSSGETSARGSDYVRATMFGLAPGQTMELRIEATDGDTVVGPNIGRSQIRKLEIASEASRRAAEIDEASALLDLAVDALADRLENPLEADTDPIARFSIVETSSELLRSTLSRAAQSGRRRDARSASSLESLAGSLRSELGRERRLYRPRPGPLESLVAGDERVVGELEDIALALREHLEEAQIEDAAAVARELEALRREISSLLAELRRTESEEARQRLMEAIANAAARMRDLEARLAEMQENVPDEFMNVDMADAEAARDALAQLDEAVERADLAAAERALLDLERRINALASALREGQQAFGAARMGPRERALADALDRVAGLESEERDLAGSTNDVRRRATERALDETGARNESAAQELAERARELGESYGSSSLDVGSDRESIARVRARLDDIEDALAAGDLAEAQRMADEGANDADALARNLELDALMFPGHDGETRRAAETARRLERELRELRGGVERAIPRVNEFVDERDRGDLQASAERQRAAIDAASALERAFEEGPDGTPLDPDAASAMGEIRQAMENALRSLRENDPVDASRAQDDAAEALAELRRRLEESSSSQGGGGSDGEGSQDRAPDEEVEIPGADAFRGPAEMRRRILDAMREGAPDGYDARVRRYYEELLR